MGHDVFISYSHKDSRIADAICNRLESAGIRCWYAPRDIQPGHEWAEDIIDALGRSRIMVLIFTDDSNASTQVRREVNAAVSAGVTIIPFKCTDSVPSGSMQYYLSTLHWLDAMTHSLDVSIETLTGECSRILMLPERNAGPNAPVTLPQDSDPVKGPESRSTKEKAGPAKPPLWAIAAALAVIAVIIFAVLLRGKGNSQSPSGSDPVSENPQSPVISEDPAIPPVSPSAGQDPAVSKSPAPSPADGEYCDDPDIDSPGAEFYLYDVSSYYSDTYEKGVCLQKYFGDPLEVIEIPKVVDGWPVTYIGDKCFEDMEGIRQVILPETTEEIGYRSFYGCSDLTDINLPDSLLSTGGWTFAHTGLKEFIAPPAFESLGYGTFYSCESLKNVVLTPAVPYLGADTFAYLAKGCTITVPNPDVEVEIKAFREDADLVIIAPDSSYLNTYAKAMHLNFQPMT